MFASIIKKTEAEEFLAELSQTLYEELKDIIKPDPNSKDGKNLICTMCKYKKSSKFSTFYCRNILEHFKDKKHKDKYETAEDMKKYYGLIEKLEVLDCSDSKKNHANPLHPFIEEQKIEEEDLYKFRIAEFIVRNRLAYSLGPSLCSFISEMAANVSLSTFRDAVLSRQTVTDLVQNCIGKTLKEDIYYCMRKSPFSISVDQSSDIYGKNYLAICVKYLEENECEEPATKLLSIVQMGESYTGEAIFEKVKAEVLIDKEIEKNIMGVASDQGSNVSSPNVGLAGRLQNEYPYTIHVSDFSHLYHLILKEAVSVFPKDVLNIISDLSSHFSRSPQRRAKFEAVQVKLGLESLQILRLVESRWLSLKETTERILKLWIPLKTYFEENKLEEAEIFTKKNELYLTVLLILTSKLNYYNLRFQATHIYYDEIMDLLDESFLVFAMQIFNGKGKSLSELAKIAWNNCELDESAEVYLSEQEFATNLIANNEIMNLYEETEEGARKEIIATARKFMKKVVSGMKTRLPVEAPILKDLVVVFFKDFDKNKWKNLANRFSNIISKEQINDFNNELERFTIRFQKRYSNIVSSNLKFLQEWKNLSNDFPLLAKLAKAIAVLPHTTVPIERIFSQLKDFKTNKRNRLTAKNIEASLLVYQAYGENTASIATKAMFEKFKVKYQNDTNKMEIEEVLKNSLLIEEEEGEVISEITTSKSENTLKRKGVGVLIKEDLKKNK